MKQIRRRFFFICVIFTYFTYCFINHIKDKKFTFQSAVVITEKTLTEKNSNFIRGKFAKFN